MHMHLGGETEHPLASDGYLQNVKNTQILRRQHPRAAFLTRSSLALSWPCPGPALAMPWPCPGPALAMPWPCPGHALTLPWPCPGPALAMPWLCPGLCRTVHHSWVVAVHWEAHAKPPQTYEPLISILRSALTRRGGPPSSTNASTCLRAVEPGQTAPPMPPCKRLHASDG
jgi:hypothetical protein